MIQSNTLDTLRQLQGKQLRILGQVFDFHGATLHDKGVFLDLHVTEEAPPAPKHLSKIHAAQIAERLLLTGQFQGFRIASIFSPVNKVPGQKFAAGIAFNLPTGHGTSTGTGHSIPTAIINALQQIEL